MGLIKYRNIYFNVTKTNKQTWSLFLHIAKFKIVQGKIIFRRGTKSIWINLKSLAFVSKQKNLALTGTFRSRD